MTGRRSTTTTQPTPLEEVEPTTTPPPDTAPEPGTAPVEDPPASPDPDGPDDAPRDPFAGFRALTRQFATDQGEDYPLTVHEAIAEVTRRVDAIAKDRTASQGGSYKYRGIDDVFSALHPLLGDVGLVILPGRVIREQWETRATSSGGTLNVARLLIRYRLIGPDGSTTTGEAWGEGGDSGDKATQKAHSQSYKSFALQLFSIPTEDSQRDEPDATNPPARPFTEEEQRRAQTAWQAAINAETLDALVGVRRRAEHLLAVPVDATGDGTLAPLSWWFEQRRTELEGVTG
jgi:hypothetical protein